MSDADQANAKGRDDAITLGKDVTKAIPDIVKAGTK